MLWLGAPVSGASQMALSSQHPVWRAALLAGLIAILVNTAMLPLGHVLGIDTGDGGLLMFLASHLGVAPIPWQRGMLALLPMKIWMTAFHVLTGMGMAVFYVGAIVPLLHRRCSATTMGLIYAGALWLVNAFWILPALGMGVAGLQRLTGAGIAYYALAHTMFFLLLAWLYQAFAARWQKLG
ncbi:MAG: hypothetical protein NVSMB6_27830 [Burkholderiaceae bacterium]